MSVSLEISTPVVYNHAINQSFARTIIRRKKEYLTTFNAISKYKGYQTYYYVITAS